MEVVSDFSEPAIGSCFLTKHNWSAECYQLFKNDVDALLSDNISPVDHEMFLQKILTTAHTLYALFEEEKQYFLGDVLLGWAIKQQKVSIGTLWSQQLHYKQLDQIDLQFEYFGELLQQTLDGFDYLMHYFPSSLLEDTCNKFCTLAQNFLYYSIIISRQPPSVLVKCGDAENNRRSKFWFDTEIRILGGRAFGIDICGEGCKINCYLITGDTAKAVLEDGNYNVYGDEEFSLERSVAIFQKKGSHVFRAKFDDMRVVKKDSLKRPCVAQKRYFLCYTVSLRTSSGMELVGKKISLPFALLVAPKSEVEAKLFLERSFADLVRDPLSDHPQMVTCTEMAEALEMKFQAIVETPQKNTDVPNVVKPRMFSMQTKQHIISRLRPTPQGYVYLDNFLKLPVAENFQLKKPPAVGGEWKLVPYYEWYFKLGEIVNKSMYNMWYDGLIFGFCSKEGAEKMLHNSSKSTLLVRFSDVEYGRIKISVKHRSGDIRHHWYDHSDLVARSLPKELLQNQRFAKVELIYPDINLEVALGGREIPSICAPRVFQLDEVYFDNQRAATAAY